MSEETRPASRFAARLDGSLAAIASLRDRLDVIAAAADTLSGVRANGGTIYTCGNGGSAAEALHFAEELVGRYRSDRAPIAAICLNADPTALTCIANDYGYEEVFRRPCDALLKPTDALVVLSTSGNSENLVRALDVARARGTTTIGLLGRTGGACAPLCDHAVNVDADDSAHVQEAHQVVMHLWCEALEG